MNAGEYLRQGNKQASEKTWGAVAQALKAITERRGWNHSSHPLFIDIARQVTGEESRPDWFLTFMATGELKATGAVDPKRFATRWDVASLLRLGEIYELERKYGVSEVIPTNV